MHRLRSSFLAHYLDQNDIATVVQRHPDVILITNERGEIVYANTVGTRLLCRLPENEGFIHKEFTPDFKFSFVANIEDLNEQVMTFEVNRLEIKWQVNPAYLVCLHDITRHTKHCNELEQLLYNDHLTGLHNSRGLEVLSAHVRSIATRCKQAITAFYVDVNDLKQINDSFGHSMGDAAIVETAEVINQSFRNADVRARVGGDEFVVLVLDDEIDTVDAMLERLSKEVDKCNALPDRRYTLSISIGVGRYEANHEFNIKQLIQDADHRMYVAKQQRNDGNVRQCNYHWSLTDKPKGDTKLSVV